MATWVNKNSPHIRPPTARCHLSEDVESDRVIVMVDLEEDTHTGDERSLTIVNLDGDYEIPIPAGLLDKGMPLVPILTITAARGWEAPSVGDNVVLAQVTPTGPSIELSECIISFTLPNDVNLIAKPCHAIECLH